MAHLTVYKDTSSDFTVVSNRFIDEYMADANDAQLKIYFYLLRMLDSQQSISVSGIADKFNHTEKDVIRALKYWQKHHVLDLDLDDSQNLVGIRMLSLTAAKSAVAESMHPSVSGEAASLAADTSNITAFTTQMVSDEAAAFSESSYRADSGKETPASRNTAAFSKPSYSLDQLQEFKNREQTAQLLFVAESYIGRPLTPPEMTTMLFFTDGLHFSEDLIDYLLQYCVDRGKKDFKYIEKVALNWAEEGITSPAQAQQCSSRYDKSVYAIMNGLGKNNAPTNKELEFITRWTKDYGFTTDIILEACERTVLATDKHRFEYAESILNSWKHKNVHHKADIHKIDELYQKRRSTARTTAPTNRFNQFTQNKYDFDALEKELLSN